MSKLMSVGGGIVNVPTVYFVDAEHSYRIYMEYVHGVMVKDYFANHETTEEQALKLAERIGVVIAKIHDSNIVHGDLTTSNMLLRKTDDNLDYQIVMIDFGLSYVTQMHEDFAVDLYVLERAILSTHPNAKKIFKALLHGYEYTAKKGKNILSKLAQVRLRGRKRDMIG